MIVVIASTNSGKIKEIKEILAPLEFEFRALNDYPDIPKVIEKGKTFCENAESKASTIAKIVGLPTLADDSGLEVDCLKGRPGLSSARYAGVQQDAEANIARLLKELRNVPCEKRTARFICCMALAYPDGKVILSEGECKGRIIGCKRGARGFGYDPIFIPDGSELTFAELEPEVKNKISHRYNALLAMREKLSF